MQIEDGLEKGDRFIKNRCGSPWKDCIPQLTEYLKQLQDLRLYLADRICSLKCFYKGAI